MEFFPDWEDKFSWAVLIVFLSMTFIQLYWTLFFHARIAFHRQKSPVYTPPVSVIIAARNEEDNLYKLLPKILEQDYPKFEVVVVNHQSSDDSSFILKAYERTYRHLKVIEIERSKHLRPGKKLPLTIAVKGATYEHLVFTDADCEPSSKNWLREMAGKFSEKKKVVLGYGPYIKEKGLLNKIIRLDTVMIGLSYLSMAKARTPYMGVGRNMAYTKTVFDENKGFKSHYAIQSGDDDLFIQEVAKNNNYTVCIHPDAFCYSQAEKTWSEWYKQKSRHFTTTGQYKVIKKTLLGIYPLSLLIMYLSFGTLYWSNMVIWMPLGVLAFTLILKWWIQGKALYRLQEKEFLWFLPFWDLFYTILAPLLFYTSEKTTETTWR